MAQQIPRDLGVGWDGHRVEVRLETEDAGDDGEDQVRVRASCQDGSPVFSD